MQDTALGSHPAQVGGNQESTLSYGVRKSFPLKDGGLGSDNHGIPGQLQEGVSAGGALHLKSQPHFGGSGEAPVSQSILFNGEVLATHDH